MLVVCRNTAPDTGAPVPPLQLVEGPAESSPGSGGKYKALESGQMPTGTSL